MKKLCLILLTIIFLILAGSGLFANQASAASAKNTIQILLEVKEKLYQIKITILDKNKKPIEGAKVTLYSEPITKYTDKQGVVIFENVSPGEHRIVVEHKGQIGEQKVVLSGQMETFDFRITLVPTNPFLQPEVVAVIATLALLIVGIGVLFFRKGERGR